MNFNNNFWIYNAVRRVQQGLVLTLENGFCGTQTHKCKVISRAPNAQAKIIVVLDTSSKIGSPFNFGANIGLRRLIAQWRFSKMIVFNETRWIHKPSLHWVSVISWNHAWFSSCQYGGTFYSGDITDDSLADTELEDLGIREQWLESAKENGLPIEFKLELITTLVRVNPMYVSGISWYAFRIWCISLSQNILIHPFSSVIINLGFTQENTLNRYHILN